MANNVNLGVHTNQNYPQSLQGYINMHEQARVTPIADISMSMRNTGVNMAPTRKADIVMVSALSPCHHSSDTYS